MPTSHAYQLNEIMSAIIETSPKSILDVGVGFGKYGYLSREYLELYDGRETYDDWRIIIDGIEAFKNYLTPVHDFVYDTIYIGDAIEILPTLETTYDLILLIDILEHFDYQTAINFLDECTKKGRNILLSTPKKVSLQKEAFSNPFETHKYQFSKKDFSQYENKCFIPNEYSLICYIGEKAALFRKALFNMKIRQCLPFLKYPYRILKKLNYK